MKALLALLCLTCVCRAANIVIYDPASAPVANRVVGYLVSEDTSKWEGVANTVINPTMPPGVTLENLKVASGVVVELTTGEKTSIATAQAAAIIAAAKVAAKGQFDGNLADSRLLRAIVEVIADQLNTLRTQPTTVFSAVTDAQVRTAIRNKLDADP